MHFESNPIPKADVDPGAGPWYKELTRYHWFVLVVAALGWLFDTMDQQLFNLARVPAMRELLKPAAATAPVSPGATEPAPIDEGARKAAEAERKKEINWYAGL